MPHVRHTTCAHRRTIPARRHAVRLAATTLALTLTATVAVAQDRVGPQTGYRERFEILYEFDRPDNRSARVIYGNAAAASVTAAAVSEARISGAGIFPYGSVLVMEVYRTKRDASGEVLLDANGRYQRDAMFGTFIMRKERDFGAKYGFARNGEWEYMAYRANGSPMGTPASTISCATCHMEAGQGQDWVFGVHRMTGTSTMPAPGPNTVVFSDYEVHPPVLRVTAGTEVTWMNEDLFMHTVTASDGSFSLPLRRGLTARRTFEEAGEYEYFSSLHSGSARGRIIVSR